MALRLRRRDVVLAFSGGFDSAVLMAYLIEQRGTERVHPVFVNYGMASQEAVAPVIAAMWERYKCPILSVPLVLHHLHANAVKKSSHLSLYQHYKDSCKTMHTKLLSSDVATFEQVLRGPYGYVPGLFTMVWSVLGAYAASRGIPQVAVGLIDDNQDTTGTPYPLDTSPDYIEVLNELRKTVWGPDAPIFRMPFIEDFKTPLDKVGVARLARNRGYDVPAELTHSCAAYPACAECAECVAKEAALAVYRGQEVP